MASITGKNTKPEIKLRKALHRRGYRYRLHTKYLPGKPDVVLRRYNAVIFINGCFWHGHDCHLFKLPDTNRVYWEEKVKTNRRRDARVVTEIQQLGWRVLTVWECSMNGKRKLESDLLLDMVENWLNSDNLDKQIRGLSD